MEGPSRADQWATVRGAGIERQPLRASVAVGLTNLPDDVLVDVAQRVAAVRGQFCVRELRPWLRTSRQLAEVGYSAVLRVTLAPRLDLCLRLPQAAPSEQADPWLGPVLAFLGRVPHVREAELRPAACCSRHERGQADMLPVWWGTVLPALPRLPLRSLTARGAAMAALADAPAGVVPLRRLELCAVGRHDAGHLRGDTSMLARYKQSLQDLRLRTVGNA